VCEAYGWPPDILADEENLRRLRPSTWNGRHKPDRGAAWTAQGNRIKLKKRLTTGNTEDTEGPTSSPAVDSRLRGCGLF
jgi:hypothetical protein